MQFFVYIFDTILIKSIFWYGLNWTNITLISFTDATSNGDAATLQNRLQNLGSSTANSTGSAAIMMEQASSPQFNGTFGFGPVGVPPTLAGSQRYNYASSLHSTIQQQNNNYQNGESFDSENFIVQSMTI